MRCAPMPATHEGGPQADDPPISSGRDGMRQQATSAGPEGAMRRATRSSAVAGVAVALALVFGTALTFISPALAQSRTLKMQSTCPASLTLQDNFRFFGERVEKLTGGQLKIDVNAAGQIVGAFEIL